MLHDFLNVAPVYFGFVRSFPNIVSLSLIALFDLVRTRVYSKSKTTHIKVVIITLSSLTQIFLGMILLMSVFSLCQKPQRMLHFRMVHAK